MLRSCRRFKGQLNSEDVNAIISYIKSFGKVEIEKARQQEVHKPKEELSLEDVGEKLFEKNACVACHSIDGSESVGPSLLELFASRRNFQDGSGIVADEAYVKESMIEPNLKIVSGYNKDSMPSYRHLSDQELKALVEYIKGL